MLPFFPRESFGLFIMSGQFSFQGVSNYHHPCGYYTGKYNLKDDETMTDIVIVNSTKSGKYNIEEKTGKFQKMVEDALGAGASANEYRIENTGSIDSLDAIINRLISEDVGKVAVHGGDGFAALFFNRLDALKTSARRSDYAPDLLFLKGGSGNAISYCSGFRSVAEALDHFCAGEYATEKLTLLEVTAGDRRELSHFTSFGADGEIIEMYQAQKLKGIIGYIWAVLRYSFGRKLYNPVFRRNDENYDLDIDRDGEHIHHGRHEGGGISAIPFVGYGFRPYPLAVKGNAHIRFVLFGALLMPTVFKFTKWVFTRKPNRIMFDYEVDTDMVLDCSFNKPLHIQISGDVLEQKHSAVRVGFNKSNTINLVKKK